MHHYPFNIGDYLSHTQHLDEFEDLAYRRMLDYCYLNEIGLPKSVEEIARLIRMRTHSDCIANVLREYFILEDDVYKNQRVEVVLFDYHSKSGKAKESAKERWRKHKEIAHANALRTLCVGNAKQNHKTEPEPELIKTLVETKVSPQSKNNSITAKDLMTLGIDEQIAKDYLSTRKAKLTETALKGIVRESEKANISLSTVFQIMAERSWKSFKADWLKDKKTGYVSFQELALGGNYDSANKF